MARSRQSNRGLASADPATRRRVASMGGSAYHEKRGAHGSDSKSRKKA